MDRNTDFVNATWELKTRVVAHDYNNYDFTKTNFNSGIFDNVNFNKCLFDKTNLSGSKLFHNSNFYNCLFINLDFKNSTFGSHQGTYQDCVFKNCNFQGKEFNFTRFINCTLEKSKFKKINFNASSFSKCKFNSTFSDVTFNGIYDTNKGELPTLNDVDFSESKFGEFVTFINCDLSSCLPPSGKTFEELLYQLYSNDASVLSTGSKDKIILDR